ncbi:MAG TPA: hypothetical protein DD473_04505 [Planctomycetaceae bacterium]|nr:hypothetical protein [Planctomycetaceae bacterium]
MSGTSRNEVMGVVINKSAIFASLRDVSPNFKGLIAIVISKDDLKYCWHHFGILSYIVNLLFACNTA